MRDVFQRILFIFSLSLRDETAKKNLAYLQTLLELSSMELKRLYASVIRSTELTQKIEYLMKEVELSKEEIIKYTRMLRYSLKRIKARYEFARMCGLTARSLYSIVMLNDARFANLCGRKIEEYREFYVSK